jgi:hypothetical protein
MFKLAPENMRAGLEGTALKECQQKSVNYGATKENCASLAVEAKARCEQHNRSMEAASPCTGKTGAELEKCAREAGTKQP